MDLQDFIDDLFTADVVAGQSVWKIPPRTLIAAVRDQYDDLFWDYVIERYFIALESANSELCVISTIIDIVITDDILYTFAHGCDLRKRFFVRQVSGHSDTIVEIYRTLKECNRCIYDIVIWIAKTAHTTVIKTLKKIMKTDHIFILDVVFTVIWTAIDVNLDYIFLIAKIASMDYSKTSFIYNSLHNMRKDTNLNKTIGALWSNKHDKQWLCDHDQHLYKRVIKFTSKYGSLEILGSP